MNELEPEKELSELGRQVELGLLLSKKKLIA